MALPEQPVSTFERHLDGLDLVRAGDRDHVIEAIRRLDARVRAVGGAGFDPTPFFGHERLGAAVGLPAGTELWEKDETGNVSGSHKARHLFGVAVREALAARTSSRLQTAGQGAATL